MLVGRNQTWLRFASSGLALAWGTVLLVASGTGHAADQQSCSPVAHIVSIQGQLQILRAGESGWSYVRKLGTTLCLGDLLHADPGSRAALLISPETLIRLDQNSTVTISQTPDETVVEFTQDTGVWKPILMAPNPCGAGYVITRFPRKFKVLTPFINATVEGTEFLVAMRCESAQVAVFEGKVLAHDIVGGESRTFSLATGESISSGAAEPPAVKVLVKPVDAVQWALYYPPLSEAAAAPSVDGTCEQLVGQERVDCLIRRAEQSLRTGRVDEAQADIENALRESANNGDALALLAIIAITKNEKARALELARKATEVAPDAYRAWLALSYAQQADFKLEDALKSAQRSAELAPRSTTAQARVAELLMSLGRIREAERAAQAAVDANPAEARAHTILGFVYLAEIDTKRAKQAFEAAIERDSADPLPRLGLGLATIRDGKLEEGRQQIEIAVVLDPTNALIRSYVGKAYYEENSEERDKLAMTQYKIARLLDPKDPTPWLYSAILKKTQNEPVDAIRDLQTSIDLNEDRAVYRSRLLLDEDQATRSANLARVYRDAGFDQLALYEAYRSLESAPATYAAHRFLAEAYEQTPRFEMARESEQLQSALLAPIGIIPVSPFRGFKSPFAVGVPRPFFVAPSVEPTRASYNSYEPLFERPGVNLFVDGTLATQDTEAGQAIVAAARDNLAMSFGYGYFNTSGFDPYHPIEQNSGNLSAQLRATDRLHLQLDLGAADLNYGIVRYGFDPLLSTPEQFQDQSRILRIGARYEFDAQNVLLFSAANQTYTQDISASLFSIETQTDAQTGELQYGLAVEDLALTIGGGHLDGTTDVPAVAFTTDFSDDNAYVYARFSPPSGRVALHLGASYLNQHVGDEHFETTDPKVGISVHPASGVTVRAALYETSQRVLVGNATLEPTQFAGFNQLWDDPTGTSASQLGLGLDLSLGHDTYLGIEVIDRSLDVPVLFTSLSLTWRETFGRAYIYKGIPKGTLPGPLDQWSFTLSAQYLSQDANRSDFPVDGIVKLRTQLIPLALTAFASKSIALRLSATYVDREGLLLGVNEFDPGTNFWSLGADLTYILPRRHGRVSVGISNALNRHYSVIDFDPTPLPIPPEQVVYARFSLAF